MTPPDTGTLIERMEQALEQSKLMSDPGRYLLMALALRDILATFAEKGSGLDA